MKLKLRLHLVSLQLNGVNISIDIHISTIFATFEYYGRIPPGPKKAAGIFLLPKHRDAVVTECKV